MRASPDDAWVFWQRSKDQLAQLSELMEKVSVDLAHNNVPRPFINDVNKTLARFQENFSYMVRANEKGSRK